ncbi:unnamed protein product [Cunninghamella blakesleeana]
MPSVIPKSQSKTLKWAVQKSPRNKNSGKIQKPTKSYSDKLSHQMKKKLSAGTEKNEMDILSSELTFTYDTLATLEVHYDSLKLAYTSSVPELMENYSATRLSPKERELLAAYDELNLQVDHFDKKIKKLESRINELKSSPSSTPLMISSPTSSIASQSTVSPTMDQSNSFFLNDATLYDCFDFNQSSQFLNDPFLMDLSCMQPYTIPQDASFVDFTTFAQ